MQLTVNRKWYTDKSTISEMTMNGAHQAFVLEDCVRAPGVKVYGKTAIPAGTYKVVIDLSARFQRYMFHILDVPNFAGIRIHSGNTDADTDGCLLVGRSKGLDCVQESRVAFTALWEALAVQTGWDSARNIPIFALREPASITIIDAPEIDDRSPAVAGDGQ